MRRARHGGQAALEMLALAPLLVAVVAAAWQVAGVAAAALRADADLRARLVEHPAGMPSGVVRATATAPVVIPGIGRLRVSFEAGAP